MTGYIFEDISIDRFCYQGVKQHLLTQIQGLDNLTILSICFRDMPDSSIDLARIIPGLDNLKTLELEFWNTRSFTYYPRKKIRLGNHPWLGDVFQAIGNKLKLEKLSLCFRTFDFENSGVLFNSM